MNKVSRNNKVKLKKFEYVKAGDILFVNFFDNKVTTMKVASAGEPDHDVNPVWIIDGKRKQYSRDEVISLKLVSNGSDGSFTNITVHIPKEACEAYQPLPYITVSTYER